MQWSGGRGSGGEGRGSYVTAVPSEFSGVVWRSLKFSRFSLLPPPLEPLNQPGGGFFSGEGQPLSVDGWLEKCAQSRSMGASELQREPVPGQA